MCNSAFRPGRHVKYEASVEPVKKDKALLLWKPFDKWSDGPGSSTRSGAKGGDERFLGSAAEAGLQPDAPPWGRSRTEG